MAERKRIIITLTEDLDDGDFDLFVEDLRQVCRDASRVSDVTIAVEGIDEVPTEPPLLLPGSVLARLLEGELTVGKNGMAVRSTILTPEGDGDPADIRGGSKGGNALVHYSGNAIRDSGVEDMLCFFLMKRWETMRHLGRSNLFGSIEAWVRDPRRSPQDDPQYKKLQSWEPDGIHTWGPIHQEADSISMTLEQALRGKAT